MMRDYSREFRILRAIGELDAKLQAGYAITRPLVAAAEFSARPWARAARVLHHLSEGYHSTFWVSHHLVGSARNGHPTSALVRSLWEQAPDVACVTWADSLYIWRDVFGAPVANEPRTNNHFYSPETEDEILERVRLSESSWVVRPHPDRGLDLTLDTTEPPPHIAHTTQRIIDRTRRFDACRAWLLWGPPGAGKTRAARQITGALCSSVVTLTGSATVDPSAWRLLEVLRPEGIIIDDLDSAANPDALLEHFDRAHDYARVIVSTANVTEGLRGALVRPGRAADEEPVEFASLDSDARRVIAPSVADAPGAESLLACYLAELEARARAGVLDREADIAEMRQRMTLAGER